LDGTQIILKKVKNRKWTKFNSNQKMFVDSLKILNSI